MSEDHTYCMATLSPVNSETERDIPLNTEEYSPSRCGRGVRRVSTPPPSRPFRALSIIRIAVLFFALVFTALTLVYSGETEHALALLLALTKAALQIPLAVASNVTSNRTV